MKTKRIGKLLVIGVVAVVLLAGLVLPGCGPEVTPAPTTAPAPAPSPTTAPAPAPTTAPAPAPSPTTAPAPAPTGVTPQYGGVLRWIATEVPTGSIGVPENMRGAGSMSVKPSVLEPLFNMTLQGEIQPVLATGYEWSDDLKTITIKLRQGVKFHDGTDFNAQAVKWNWDKRTEAHSIGTAEVESYEVVDDYTFRITLKEFTNAWMDNLCSVGQAQTSLMISPTAFDTNGVEWANWNPIGTGPFKFVKYERDQYLEYVRNDDYWGDKPYLDGFKVVFIPDRVTAQLAMEADEGDYLFVMGGQADVANALKPKGFQELYAPGLAFSLALPSARTNTPYANQKVREAIEYAIDKDKIVKGIYGDYAVPWYQLTKPEQLPYDPNFAGRRYDAEKARQLLKEAGYAQGFSTTLYCQQMIYGKDIDAVQAYLNYVGISTKIEVISVGKWIEMETSGWADGMIVGPFGAETYRATLDRFWVEPTEPNWFHGLWWQTVARPPELQPLINEYFKINDLAAEKAKGQEIVQLLYDRAIAVPLWDLRGVTMASPKVHAPDVDWQWITGGIAGKPVDKYWLSK